VCSLAYAAAIDIGTHSALLLVAEVHGERLRPIVDQATTTKLGASFDPAVGIGSDALARLLDALVSYRATLAAYPDVVPQVVGTAVFRRARNAPQIQQVIQQQLGWPLRILSPAEEADLSFRAIAQLVQPQADQPLVAIDLGGGSTEVVIAQGGQRQDWSLPLGAVGLQERFATADQLSVVDQGTLDDYLNQQVATIPAPTGPAQVVLTGGTATTLASLMLDLSSYDPLQVEQVLCPAEQVESLFRELNQLSLSQRQDLIAMEPGRADVILPALRWVMALLRHFDCPQLVLTGRGLRYGLLLP